MTTPGERMWNYYATECAKFPSLPPRSTWAETSKETRDAWEKRAAESPTFNPFPQAEPDGKYQPRGRLKPRHTLPGDMRTEWLHGWWCGIGVGCVIGAALAVMVVWSR